MKGKILEGLATKFVGVKAEILDRIAAKAAKTITTEEEVNTYVDGVTLQQVIESYADSRTTDAVKTAIGNYEKKYNLKDGKTVEPTDPKPTDPKPAGGDDVPAWAKALMEQNEKLTARLADMDNEKTAKSRKAMLEEVLKDLPASLQSAYTDGFERLSFKDAEDFNGWLEKTKANVDSVKQDYDKSKAGINPPKAGGKETPKDVNPLVQARIDAAAKAYEADTSTAIKG